AAGQAVRLKASGSSGIEEKPRSGSFPVKDELGNWPARRSAGRLPVRMPHGDGRHELIGIGRLEKRLDLGAALENLTEPHASETRFMNGEQHSLNAGADRLEVVCPVIARRRIKERGYDHVCRPDDCPVTGE